MLSSACRLPAHQHERGGYSPKASRIHCTWRGHAVDQEYVEAARSFRPAREIEPRRSDQPRALGRGDALACAAEARAAAHAHLGEHQHAALLGDQVDLAVPAAPVALDQAAARRARSRLGAEILGSRTFGVHGTLNGHGGAAVDLGTHEPSCTSWRRPSATSPMRARAPSRSCAAADLIACEDTRTTRTLLARHGIATRTVALHEHNERARRRTS